MSIYSKARKHIDMKRVKEIREEKIKREKIAEILRQQKEILAELVEIEAEQSKYVDWRKGDINEQMTTAGLGMINYPAEGDVDLEDISNKVTSLGSNAGYSESGNTYTFGPVVNPGENPRGSSLVLGNLDARKYDTISFDFSAGTIDEFQVLIAGSVSTYNLSPQSGRKTVTLKSGDRISGLSIAFLIFNDRNGNDLPVGTNIISNLSFQRRTPVNVFVSLDDPEANSFLRDGQTDNLSPGEKKKKLEEQLKSSKEYLNKMFGEGMPNTATTISDYEPQQSFMDIQAGGERITKQGGKTVTDTTRGIKDGKIDGKPIRSSTPTSKSVPFTGLSPEDLKSISDRVGGSYSGTTSQPDKQPVKGVPFTGLSPEDLKSISDRVGGSYSGKTNPKTTLSNPPKSSDNKAALEKNIKASLKQLEIDNEQLKGDALKRNIGLAADLGLDILTAVTMLTPIPGDEAAAIAVQASKAGVKTGAKTMAQQRTIDAFRTQVTDPKNLSRAQELLSRTPAKFKRDVVIPIKVQGKTINVKANEILRNKGFKIIGEKKSYNDLTKKIPGYYDGKPAPLGFPLEEPPKMKNGFHPDLIDGKKTAKRFNRLDPVSAKAMPKTGNSHIDKKVKAAAKKPK